MLRFIFCITFLCLSFGCFSSDAALSPILIITGYSGSRLYVQDTSNTNCNTNGETIRIWVNDTHIATAPECFINQMRLNFTGGQYLDPQDVNILTQDFGKLSSFVDLSDVFLIDSDPIPMDYFIDRGYTADVNIRAAPYDWRLGAEQLKERSYYNNLKQLVERMYEDNGNTKVTLLVYSMGGPVSLYFLTQTVNQEWKDTYIHSYISLAAAWSGASGVFRVLTQPATSAVFFRPIQASPQDILSLMRTLPSSYWLLPRAFAFSDTILVSTPIRNYTASDYEQLFMDAGYPQGYTQVIESDINFPAPNVSTYCFYGLGFPTELTAVYNSSFPNAQPTILYGEGDGLVNKQSLEVCLRWANSGYQFNRTIFPGLDHFTITTEAVLQAVGRIVGAPVNPINGVSPLATIQPIYLFVVIFISITYSVF